MTQASASRPSLESCTRLLRVLPAMSALKRTLREAAPPDSHGWLGALFVTARIDGGARPSHVADHLMVDLSVASRSISQLEELGYVERTRDPADGRAWLVQVTPAGRDRLDQVRIAFAAHVRGLLPGWTDAEVDSIADQLRRFGDTIATANAAADRAEGTPA